MAVFQIAARLQKLQPDEKVLVRTPLDVYLLLGLELAFLDQEHLRVILVNTRSQVIAITEVYVGNVSSALVRVSELFKEAVRQNAPAIILVHNHPSGDPTPSPDDVVLTKQAAAAGKLLNIEVMDHIIIGRDGSKYLSMQQMGLGGLSET
jgi:DNA repair protein RadC